MRLEEVRLLTPRITPIDAQLVVCASWSDDDPSPLSPELRGSIVGPMCEYAKTLMDRISLAPMHRLTNLAPHQVLACARVLEPCFWDPQHPFCYEVSIELHHSDHIVD